MQPLGIGHITGFCKAAISCIAGGNHQRRVSATKIVWVWVLNSQASQRPAIKAINASGFGFTAFGTRHLEIYAVG